MDLTSADRLKVHLALHCPGVKMKHVRLSDVPGFLELSPFGRIDIRGAGYANDNPSLRLWNELHGHFAQHVEVIKRKNGIPTLIEWNGMVYHLDQTRSFVTVYRRNEHNRERRKNTEKESG